MLVPVQVSKTMFVVQVVFRMMRVLKELLRMLLMVVSKMFATPNMFNQVMVTVRGVVSTVVVVNIIVVVVGVVVNMYVDVVVDIVVREVTSGDSVKLVWKEMLIIVIIVSFVGQLNMQKLTVQRTKVQKTSECCNGYEVVYN